MPSENEKGRLKLYLGANPHDFSVGKIQTQTAYDSIALHGNGFSIHNFWACVKNIFGCGGRSRTGCLLVMSQAGYSFPTPRDGLLVAAHIKQCLCN